MAPPGCALGVGLKGPFHLPCESTKSTYLLLHVPGISMKPWNSRCSLALFLRLTISSRSCDGWCAEKVQSRYSQRRILSLSPGKGSITNGALVYVTRWSRSPTHQHPGSRNRRQSQKPKPKDPLNSAFLDGGSLHRTHTAPMPYTVYLGVNRRLLCVSHPGGRVCGGR